MRLVWVVIINVSFFISSGAWAQGRFLDYFPSSENIESVVKTYPNTVLGEVSCAPANDYAQRTTDCIECLELKTGCPDCCLDLAAAATRCTSQADPDYDCDPYAFSADSCLQVECPDPLSTDCSASNRNRIPDCQEKACPDPTYEPIPDPNAAQACTQDGASEDWFCTADNLIPDKRGCEPVNDSAIRQALGYNPDFHALPPQPSVFYTITTESPCPAQAAENLDLDTEDDCYKYVPKPDYKTYVTDCHTYTEDSETCKKEKHCCKEEVCPGSEVGPGFDNNCNKGICDDRLSWNKTVEVTPGLFKDCDQLTLTDCNYLQNLVQNCLSDIEGGECRVCFQEIDPDFHYKFVAKSGESIVVIWQVSVTSLTPQLVPAYFYTMVEVVDKDGRPAHTSMIHQKSFQGAFSIYSATSIDADENILEQGKTYYARLYYFIPEIDTTDLQMKINYTELITVKIRE